MNLSFFSLRIAPALVFCHLCTIPLTAQCQPTAAVVPQTADAALRIMKSTLIYADVMTDRCKTMFPEKSGMIDAVLSAWTQSEAHVIAMTNARWLVKVAEDPQMNTFTQYTTDIVSKQFDATLNRPDGQGKSLLSDTCDSYFSRLNTGAQRHNMPKVFEFIDQMK